LEDTVDQLIILGRIMPGKFIQSSLAAKALVDAQVNEQMDGQRQAEANFERSAGRRKNCKKPLAPIGPPIGADGDPTRGDPTKSAAELAQSVQSLTQSIKQSPISTDNTEKMQADRAFLEATLHRTSVELREKATFTSLSEAIQKEKAKRTKYEDIIKREAEGRKLTRALQSRLVEVKREREAEIQKRVEMIAHLKDQLQEMKAKTSMESKYVQKVTEVDNAQVLKRCTMDEAKLVKELDDLKTKIDEENRCNAEIESFLRTHIDKRQELLHDWVDKYDNEVDMKQKELDLLKAAKAADYERLLELTRLYHEYEQVVVDDRVEKEKIRRKLEKDQEEEEAAIQIQAWWRGTMVRRCLGQYKAKKKKKGKGGKGKK